ncbi:tetratricopeptide repeat protein [Chitinispirillales bacterium ANBcel5]|uniref:tetratricopeptide repeat protein n=1 Tax=Cellulosispirillum alkaliphilum TaxID=3039283 RepID=UPI002A55C786|nr:tetratricopeptide repeat protein [Chitinispirillales bacterium ANBcel5]
MNIVSIQKKKHRTIIKYFLPFFLLLIDGSFASDPPLPAGIHALALESIEYLFNNNHPDAEQKAQIIIDTYPQHPAGYFFMAAAIDKWTDYFRSSQREDHFYRYSDLAIEKGEKILEKNPNDPIAQFFVGGANGLKGTYEFKKERWITAFRYGWKGVSVFMNIEQPNGNLIDVQYGIGSYHYWRSAMMRVLWWMPGVEDRRDEGIRMLQKVSQKGIYSKVYASVELINIYMNERRYNDALQVSNQMLKKFPNAHDFQWGKAEALYALERFTEAQDVYKKILNRLLQESRRNYYYEVQCRLKLAKTHNALMQYTQAVKQCDHISDMQLSNEISRRVSNILSEAQRERRLAQRALSK